MSNNIDNIKPETLNGLIEFCRSKNIPAEKMRFFLGTDCDEPKCFGIFAGDDGTFTVYKNKANGTRAIRYTGTDEKFAVSEIFDKMKSEIELRDPDAAKRIFGSNVKKSAGRRSKFLQSVKNIALQVVLYVSIALVAVGLSRCGTKQDNKDGYYRFDNSYYYSQKDIWYLFNPSTLKWCVADGIADALAENAMDFYDGKTYRNDMGISDFSGSEFYSYDDDEENWEDDVFDDWDTDDTDWDSDW